MNRRLLRLFFLRAGGALNRRWRGLPPALYVFNYHRIGLASESAFDPNVFSCAPERFQEQIRLIKTHFSMTSLSALSSLADSKAEMKERYALITFDDGYADNYEIAAPILEKLGVSGVFFVPTDFIGSDKIPWWDEVAWMVRKCAGKGLHLTGNTVIQISESDIDVSIRDVLRLIKKDTSKSIDYWLSEIATQLDICRSSIPKSDLFMNWEQLRELQSRGFEIGSHTASHQILSHLSADEQLSEVVRSREELKSKLGRDVVSLAYPVGGVQAYNAESKEAARKAGHKFAFNFRAGINPDLASDPFDLFRIAVEDQDDQYLKMDIIDAAYR